MPVEEIDRDFAALASLCSESELANEDQLDRALARSTSSSQGAGSSGAWGLN